MSGVEVSAQSVLVKGLADANWWVGAWGAGIRQWDDGAVPGRGGRGGGGGGVLGLHWSGGRMTDGRGTGETVNDGTSVGGGRWTEM